MREYIIKRISGTPNWNAVPQLQVDNHLWLPSEQIRVSAQIAYDEEALYVRMVAVEPV